MDAEAGADLDAQWPGENDLDFTDMDGEYDAEHRTRAGRRAKPSAPCAMQDADADERDEDMAAEDGLVDAASEENESEEDGAGEDDDREESGENAEDEEDLEAEEDFAGASAFEILSDPGEIEEALDDEDSDESEDLEELEEDEEDADDPGLESEAWDEELNAGSESGSAFDDLMIDASFDLPELDAEDDDQYEVIHQSFNCAGVRRVSIRKNRDGQEVLTRDQAGEICAAARLALTMARNSAAALDSIWAGKRLGGKRRRWRRNAAVVRWLGSRILTRRQIRVTRRRVRRILRALERGVWFVVVQHQTGRSSYLCDGNSFAYSWGSSRVFLCPSFFGRSARAQARTIIHEQVHRLGWAHPWLPGVGKVASTDGDRQRALDLARAKPMRARRSPVNLAWLFDDLRPPF